MEIEEFKKEKKLLESGIASSVQTLINTFEERTGYTPKDITISIIQEYSIGVKDKNFVDFVHTEIEI